MADFKKAFEHTMAHEGGYVDDPTDRGGETFMGIARNLHSEWAGWDIIDSKKADSTFPKCLHQTAGLKQCIRDFYKQHFWNVWAGDMFDDQAVATEMFDTAVNMGVSRAVKFLQSALNALNRDGRLYPDLTVDGKSGRKTLNALDKLEAKPGDTDLLYKMLNVLQGAHYLKIMANNSSQEKYARGWFKRVSLSK